MQKTGIVMLNDTADPDWKATIDGQPVRWFTADYLFRGVLVPAGAHTIEFRYRPRSFYLGSVISVLTALAVVAWGVRSRAKSYWATAATSACGTSSV